MRDGDVMGLLHAVDRKQKYRYKFKPSDWLVFRQTDFIFVALSARVATFLSHVPWLGAMILSYPESIPGFKKIRIYAQARAMRRIKEGSPYRDLFHHLVRYFTQFTVNDFRRDVDA